MEKKELRLKLIEVILTNVKGLNPSTVIEVSKQYEAYVNDSNKDVANPDISDKTQVPDDSQKEGRTGSDVPSKKKPR